ncbi:MAG TPA: FAD-linked oxidase C-terminal domain-containing protein, partial [Gemmataceae bacterium]|nr:FAD-linked oxidase C-terminal domain-containing protein [Gemmataceae bacterium]
MLDFSDLQRDVLQKHLRNNIEGEVRFDDTSRRLYSTDASIYQIRPLGVVIPRTTRDLVTAVQVALEMRVPVTARGGGTSLSGQSIGSGLIIDCSKYLNRVLNIDSTARTVRIQPGVVLEQLNREVFRYGLQFGPDVSTISRANLGGMIGNNSAGSRSIVYGKTIDHVRRMNVVLSDGSEAEFGAVGSAEWDRRADRATLEGGIYRTVREIVNHNAEEIRGRFPRILRRVSGYNLDALLGSSGETDPARRPGLKDLIVGSEGTLAVLTEVELDLVPRPKYRGLLVPQFSSLGAALDANAACLEFRPSAVELMDQMLIDLSREQRSLNEVMKSIPGRPAALLMVEFSSDDESEVSAKVHELQRRLNGINGLLAAVPALDAAQRDPLWNLRRAAMPLLYGIRGERKPITFVEDTAVTPERLPEFINRFREILHRHGTDGAFYGHASVGCLHIRPLLNLKDPSEIAGMRQITEEITDLVLEFGGALSGEHGDGLARSEWNRKMFGPVLYEAFRQVKRAFDPRNLFNPGKIVDAPAMTENLRYSPRKPDLPPLVFDYGRQEGFFHSIELCNGSGVCRKTQGGTMCPSFRATRDERDSTRGRANALRLALVGDSPVSENGGLDSNIENHAPLRERWLFDVMDLCLQCKACKTECPSNVDMAKLKAEFLHSYYSHRSRPFGHQLLAYVHRLYPLMSQFAPLAKLANHSRLSRWLLEKIGGIDHRRSLPDVHFHDFRRWFGKHRRKSIALASRNPKSEIRNPKSVLLLDDCFTTFQEPEIGKTAVKILELAGYEVDLAGGICCGRALISKGFLTQAREMIAQALPILEQRLQDGQPLLGLEPSCLLTIADEWPELVPGPATGRVAAAAELADHWLAQQAKEGKVPIRWPRRPGKILLHGHCHQKALRGTAGSAAALRLLGGAEVTVLDSGCCGMAGSFGYEKQHFDLSVQIANLALLPALAAEPEATVVATG